MTRDLEKGECSVSNPDHIYLRCILCLVSHTYHSIMTTGIYRNQHHYRGSLSPHHPIIFTSPSSSSCWVSLSWLLSHSQIWSELAFVPRRDQWRKNVNFLTVLRFFTNKTLFRGYWVEWKVIILEGSFKWVIIIYDIVIWVWSFKTNCISDICSEGEIILL